MMMMIIIVVICLLTQFAALSTGSTLAQVACSCTCIYLTSNHKSIVSMNIHSEINIEISQELSSRIHITMKAFGCQIPCSPLFTRRFLAVIGRIKLFFSPPIPPGLGSGAGWTGQYLTVLSGHHPCFYSWLYPSLFPRLSSFGLRSDSIPRTSERRHSSSGWHLWWISQ